MTEMMNENGASAAHNTPVGTPEKHVYTIREKLLIAAALVFAVLFDVLIWNRFADDFNKLPLFSAILMLTVIVFLCAVSYKTLFKNLFLTISVLTLALLCVWNFIFDYNSGFGWLNMFVIPSSGMALLVVVFKGFRLKECGEISVSWLSGFWVKPFSAIHHFFGALFGSFSGGNKKLIIKCLISVVITAVVLSIIVPMLMDADMVFGFYLSEAAESFNIGGIVRHMVVTLIALLLFYSFMWNLGFGKKSKSPAEAETSTLDSFVTSFVLTALLIVYALFCAVQFSYLFAGAGLPNHLTYSEYAREGFGQLVAVSGINLAIFGIATRYCNKGTLLTVLRVLLLAFTIVMAVSGFLRLYLYIGAYGLTWLRLISAWFICYLAVVTVLCAARLFWEKLPVMAVSALVLCVWFCVLGYSNPDALIERHNENRLNSVSVIYKE